ncbi:hypothetical protein OG21DRAFT_1484992 [Imleria badia]|nr:hypothetical protein OG21DRAFT_1484992 [Imleria badia]
MSSLAISTSSSAAQALSGNSLFSRTFYTSFPGSSANDFICIFPSIHWRHTVQSSQCVHFVDANNPDLIFHHHHTDNLGVRSRSFSVMILLLIISISGSSSIDLPDGPTAYLSSINPDIIGTPIPATPGIPVDWSNSTNSSSSVTVGTVVDEFAEMNGYLDLDPP